MRRGASRVRSSGSADDGGDDGVQNCRDRALRPSSHELYLVTSSVNSVFLKCVAAVVSEQCQPSPIKAVTDSTTAHCKSCAMPIVETRFVLQVYCVIRVWCANKSYEKIFFPHAYLYYHYALFYLYLFYWLFPEVLLAARVLVVVVSCYSGHFF